MPELVFFEYQRIKIGIIRNYLGLVNLFSEIAKISRVY